MSNTREMIRLSRGSRTPQNVSMRKEKLRTYIASSKPRERHHLALQGMIRDSTIMIKIYMKHVMECPALV